jgi:hypothetical protein
VRTRTGFGVVLDRETTLLGAADALNDAVIEIHVAHHAALQRIGYDRVVVVLGGDFNASGREILDGMVAAVVTEGQLERSSSESVGQELVAEADAKDRRGAKKICEYRDLRPESSRVTGAVREEDAVGMKLTNVVGAG